MTHPPERYLRELPPRRLDPLSQAVLLLGDWVSQAGWALLALGTVFFWSTSVNSDFGNSLGGSDVVWKKKAGVILGADSTGTVEAGKKIWHYRHSFAINGQRYLGESFSVGKKFDENQIAFIQFDAADPSHNFMVGLRQKQFGKQVNWMLFIPLLGLPLVLWPIRANLKFIRLLKIGEFARGKFLDKNATGRSRKQGVTVIPEMRYEFAFPYENAEYLATCTTYLTHLLEDEESEMVLFDKYEPTYNLVYDAIPNMPKIDENGKMLPVEGWKAGVLFLPVFTLLTNLFFYWLS